LKLQPDTKATNKIKILKEILNSKTKIQQLTAEQTFQLMRINVDYNPISQ